MLHNTRTVLQQTVLQQAQDNDSVAVDSAADVADVAEETQQGTLVLQKMMVASLLVTESLCAA
jgi:hypothetical protein